MSIEFKKSGIVAASLFETPIVEPDGSVWVPVFRHVNPSGQLFSSSDTFSTGVYKNPGLYFNFNICKSLDKWEFIYAQKSTATSNLVKYRWIQTVSPFGTSYDAVKPASVTRITTSGYTDGSYGGLYNLNSSTYMVVANTSNGNWFGATGCWTTYQGGIPGYPNTTCTTGEINIYVRIDNTNYTNTTQLFKSDIVLSPDFIEN